MAEAATTTRPKGIQRLQIGLNVLVQLILIFFLFSAVKGKMRITVFFSPTTPISGDVASLLTEYQYAANGKIDVENIDPQRNLSRAKELFDKYKVVSDESLLVIDYE